MKKGNLQQNLVLKIKNREFTTDISKISVFCMQNFCKKQNIDTRMKSEKSIEKKEKFIYIQKIK